jgi:hypothetical protein
MTKLTPVQLVKWLKTLPWPKGESWSDWMPVQEDSWAEDDPVSYACGDGDHEVILSVDNDGYLYVFRHGLGRPDYDVQRPILDAIDAERRAERFDDFLKHVDD